MTDYTFEKKTNIDNCLWILLA